MPKPPRISDAEWHVMQVLWDHSPLTAGQVVDQLAGSTDWNPRTIKTLISRLVRKGALTYEEQGNLYLYRPAVTRQQCLRSRSDSFLAGLTGDLTLPALVHFVRKAKLSKSDIAELRKLLDEKES